jgi:hypothetical protein
MRHERLGVTKGYLTDKAHEDGFHGNREVCHLSSQRRRGEGVLIILIPVLSVVVHVALISLLPLRIGALCCL